MLASSVTMVGYVWIRYITHSQTEFRQTSQFTSYSEEDQSVAESVAA